jgi:hypothetical protein
MNKARQQLIDFAEKAKGLDDSSRLKLILVASGAKPATFFPLKINPRNLDEKSHLEKHLRAAGLIFSAGKARGYEEIVGVRDNAVLWKLNGTWYGYDVFKDKKHRQQFKKYVGLVKRQQHETADRISGTLYDYPPCCVEHYVKEHDAGYLRKKYTHYSYYKHLHDIERAFPLVMHTACSTKCAKTRRLNNNYAAALRKNAPGFWKRFSAVKKFSSDVIADTESELVRDGSSVFRHKDGHEYTLITLKPLDRHHYLLAHLSKKAIPRGTVLPAQVIKQYGYADVSLGKPKRVIKDLHHERHFLTK